MTHAQVDIAVCDFCSDLNPPYVMAADDTGVCIVAIKGDGSRETYAHNSVGGWTACKVCKNFIEANDRRGLEERAIFMFKKITPPSGTDPHLFTEMVRLTVRSMQGAFFRAFKGKQEVKQ